MLILYLHGLDYKYLSQEMIPPVHVCSHENIHMYRI